MTGVLNSDASRLPANDPTGYYRHALGPLRPAPQEGTGWMFAAGELAMPASDLAKWNISLMNRSLLSAASYDEMFREVKLKDGKGSGYGLGVEVGVRDGRNFVEHSGEVSGFVSMNSIYPDDKAAVTVLTNEDAVNAAGTLQQQIAAIMLKPAQMPPTAPPAPAAAPVPPDAAAAEKRAEEIFVGLQMGKIDRTQLTELCKGYFTREAVEDFKTSLAPLGKPVSFTQTHEEKRGGMVFRAFKVVFPDRTMRVTVFEEPDGKLEQYLVAPVMG
jgi:hypothetical protein